MIATVEKTEEKVPRTELAPFESWLPTFSTSPFGFMRRFSEDMDRFFEDFWGRPASLTGTPRAIESFTWTPKVEVLRKNDQFIVRADLPGLTKEDVTLEITEEALTIEGERKHEKEEKGEGFYRSERAYGNFYRCIPLPEGVLAESAKATFKNGVLEVVVKTPPLPERRSRRLEIDTK